MKENHFTRHLLALVLVACLVLQCGLVAGAAVTGSPGSVTLTETTADAVSAVVTGDESAVTQAEDAVAEYADTDVVRVSIVLEKQSTIEAGFSTTEIASNRSAMAYRSALKKTQMDMENEISRKILGGQELDVVWNLTLAANLISANVLYGKIDEIASLAGVRAVYIETVYEPVVEQTDAEINTLPSGAMTGTPGAWASGYSGAGSRIAIIDTGTDTDHQSFDPDAFQYALLVQGAQAVKQGEFDTVDEYIDSLNLLDSQQIAGVLTELNAYSRHGSLLSAEDLYINAKLPFAYNYVDSLLDVTHDNDTQGEHGSHVAGIAAANSYIPGEDGYVSAADTVYAVGQAPEAQIITMKVFGQSGGAYDSDYMAAIEDAILLGCDAVNLSLGSTNVGFTYNSTGYYNELFEALASTDTVVSIAASNSYSWSYYANNGAGLLYADDVNDDRVASPGSYANAFTVASVDNTGFTGAVSVFTGDNGGYSVGVTDAGSPPAGYQIWTTLDTTQDGSGTEYDYVFLGDPSWLLDPDYEGEDAGNYLGNLEDYEGFDYTGKIVLVARGTLAFAVKHANAGLSGAAGIVIYNNTTGTISMDISASDATIPCGSITLEDAKKIFAVSARNEDGIYGGKVSVCGRVSLIYGSEDAEMIMSEFSSWGVPENLTMKPEITAPGGSIYSVDGSTSATDAYELMSGTSMATPQITGISAIVLQYIRQNGLAEKTGLTARALAQSLMMSTAEPVIQAETGLEYSVRKQGAGLANTDNAINASSYILVGDKQGNDGKVKVELGDDPDKTGNYSFDFTVYNLTDQIQNYTLDPSILVPAAISDDETVYMDSTTCALNPEVSFTTSLDPDTELFYDFDGDGDVDNDDVQALLDYLAGNRSSIANAGYADISGNGKLDTYDAHLLMEYVATGANAVVLEPAQYITVPAGGEVTITVTVTLSDSDRAYIEENYKNGTYVEGFVYLNAVADSEGAVPVSHSIPMLAFYGKWSDASMFDRGEYTSDYYALRDGTAELRYVLNGGYANYMTTRVGGSQSYYGLNLFAEDEVYLPERASLSAAAGSAISRINYTLIRCSAETKVIVTDDETGEIYYENSLGQQNNAYYNVSGNVWNNTSTSATVNWKGTDAQGNPLPDGTRTTISLIAASEYYRNADGTIEWDALGDGAYYSMPVLIDNEAPVVSAATYTDDVMTGDSTFTVTVQDNHYTAALILLNEKGTKVMSRTALNQTSEGAQLTAAVDMDGVIGNKFILMAVDYAGNATYYNVTINKTGSVGSFYAFNTGSNSWVNFSASVNQNETVLSAADTGFVAGDYAEGYIFAVSAGGDLYAIPLNDIAGGATRVKGLYYEYVDLAYDTSSSVLYGLRNYDNGNSYLYSINLGNGSEQYIATVTGNYRSFAVDGTGTFYGITAEGILCSFTVENGTPVEIGSVGVSLKSNQSTTVDNGTLYWANGTALTAISLADASAQQVGTLSSAATCLCYTAYNTGAFDKVDYVSGISVSGGNKQVFIGNSVQLTATVRPWYTTNAAITWSSSDETIATVDQNGVVNTCGVGTATITATSVLTPAVSASCTITVINMEQVIYGVTNTESGAASLFRRDLSTGVTTTTAVNGMSNIHAATFDAADQALWVMDEGGTLYHVDETTGDVLSSVASGSGIAVNDMEYSQLFGGFYSLYGAYLLVPVAFEDNAPGSGFNFTAYLAQYTGGTAFVAMVSMGRDSYQGQTCEHLLLLDDTGSIWQLYLYKVGSGYSCYLGYGATGLAGQFSTAMYNSAIYAASYGTAGGMLVSVYDGAGGNVLYMIDLSNFANVVTIGSISQGTYPAALYRVTDVEAAGANTDAVQNVTMIDAAIEATAVSLS